MAERESVQQCEYSETPVFRRLRCIYVAGHGGNHYCPDDNLDHSDEIRLRVVKDRLDAAEATGQAAVRALAKEWKHADHSEDGALCSSEQCREVAAVLDTDTAKRWRLEVQDD